jgi:hypothetical protein
MIVQDKVYPKTWCTDLGQLHREDGPAIIWAGGHYEYWHQGALHRMDGPAVKRPDGQYKWYIDHMQYNTNCEYQEAAGLTDAEMTFIILTYGNVS